MQCARTAGRVGEADLQGVRPTVRQRREARRDSSGCRRQERQGDDATGTEDAGHHHREGSGYEAAESGSRSVRAQSLRVVTCRASERTSTGNRIQV